MKAEYIANVGRIVAVATLNFVSEANDFIGAMHAALPDSYKTVKRETVLTANGFRRKRRELLPHEMANDLWHGVGHVRLEEALENYINMQIGDFLAAAPGIGSQRLYKETGQLTGVDRALSKAGSADYDASQVPVVDIDLNRGEIGVTVFGRRRVVNLGDRVF